MDIVILITCHNRKEKTISCLLNLYSCSLPKEIDILDVFLVDDGSSDGTSREVKKEFPQVNVIKGNGNLFWNQGMRLAWNKAFQKNNYDFYLWLNDDTILDFKAIDELFECNQIALQKDGKSALITGACRALDNKNDFSYGGRTEKGPVLPYGKLQNCTYINGNAVLVPQSIFNELGNLSNDYTHGMGDFDYGLRAIKKGFSCYTTRKYIATCPPNVGVPGWCNPENTLKKRWALFHSPLGLNIKEYNKFRKKFWGKKWMSFAIKAYSKMLSPKLYNKLS